MSSNYSPSTNPYASFGLAELAVEAPAVARVAFLKRTYIHLAAAVYALVGLEYFAFQTLPLDQWMPALFTTPFAWLGCLVAFMVVGNLAERWAQSATSVNTQYLGLVSYVLAETLILMPLLWIASDLSVSVGGTQYSTLLAAAVATLAIFSGLTAAVLLTKVDFSFLGPVLGIASMAALAAMVLAAFGLVNLGMLFAVALAVVASGYVLYHTSQVLHNYRTDQHVAASLALFASLALLFWYVLRIAIYLSSNRD